MEWSYLLLRPSERELFARLSVFAATFDLDAAVAVGGGDEFDVLDDLVSLVAKSMVMVDEHPLLGTRYRLLETLRAYGHQQLDDTGLLELVRDDHARHYSARAAAAAEGLLGFDTGRAAARVLADAADYRAAVAWLSATGHLDEALGLASDPSYVALSWDWWEPHEWLRNLLADPAADACPRHSAALGALPLSTLWHDGDVAEAERLAMAAIDSRAHAPEVPPVLSAEFAMSFASLVRGEAEASVAWSQRFIERGPSR